MIETLANGVLDAWWEYAILIAITLPFWFPVFQLLMHILARVSIFILNLLLHGKL